MAAPQLQPRPKRLWAATILNVLIGGLAVGSLVFLLTSARVSDKAKPSPQVSAADTGSRQIQIYWRDFPRSAEKVASNDYNRRFAESVSPDFVRAVIADLVNSPSAPKQAEYANVLYFISSFNVRQILVQLARSSPVRQRQVAIELLDSLDQKATDADRQRGK
jgi:hypothetical protein